MPPDARASHVHAGLTTERIVAAAMELIRETGVGGMSMRMLAARLGVRAPSLYHHVAGRDELLELIARHGFDALETDLAAFDSIATVEQFVSLLRAIVLDVRAVYHAHRGLAALMLQTASARRDRDATPRGTYMAGEIAALRRLGVRPRLARDLYEAGARWTMAAIIAEELPHPDGQHDDLRFELGLDMYLDGLCARIRAETTSAPVRRRHRPTRSTSSG